jgi:hypothetical protein
MVSFEMDPNFERNLLREAAGKVERDFQAAFDRLGRQYRGADLATIRAAFKREGIVGEDGEPDDEWLEAVRDGVRLRPDVSSWRK